MNALVRDDRGLRHDHGYYKLKCMVCNENTVKFREGNVATLWVKFDGKLQLL